MGPRTQKDIEMVHIGHEAEAEARDVESLQPLPRSLSSAQSWKIRQHVGTSLSATNLSSAISHLSISWFARWSPGPNRTAEEIILREPLSKAHDNFLAALLGEQPRERPSEACTWYIDFLEFKIREAWLTLVVDRFQSLQTTVEHLGRKDLALMDVVDEIYNNKLLKLTDYKRSHACQLVLACLGWTMGTLFSANVNPDPPRLQIASPRALSSCCDFKSKKTFTKFSQTLDSIDQPLHILLQQFGTVIPQRQKQWLSGQSTPLPASHAGHDDDWIDASLLSFNTLNKIAKVQIEWVDSLSQHLEFETCSKMLKVYRLPSLCLLMCCCEKESPLSRIFSGATNSNRYLSAELEDAYNFHHEALLSYRLIFGQDLTSSSDLLAHLKKFPMPFLYADPLLPALCGSNWESNDQAKHVYKSLGADDPSPLLPSTQFPFLGQRLLDLQMYVKRHKPHDFRSLWHDKRDSLSWWTFWAVVILSGVTLLLTVVFGFLQTILGGYQVYYAREQVLQHQMPQR
ncbi:hypothetical protein V8E51_004263 [Hyaloscypha variabilis]